MLGRLWPTQLDFGGQHNSVNPAKSGQLAAYLGNGGEKRRLADQRLSALRILSQPHNAHGSFAGQGPLLGQTGRWHRKAERRQLVGERRAARPTPGRAVCRSALKLIYVKWMVRNGKRS